MPLLTRIAAGAALLLIAAVAALYLAQRRLLYFPAVSALAESRRLARAAGLEPWLDGDGRFIGWQARLPSVAPVARVVVLHGNAGSALDRTYLRDVLQGPRRLWEEAGAFHNTLRFDPADPLWTEVWAFLRGAG